MGFGLDDWIYWRLIHLHLGTTGDYSSDIKDGFWIGWLDLLTPYTFATWDYRRLQHYHWSTQFTGFWVFTSCIPVTDLSQSHCNFKLHMKFSWHSLIPFLPFLLNCLRLPSPELDLFLDNHSFKWTLLQLNSLNFWQLTALLELLII
jgi:hypothetical protein